MEAQYPRLRGSGRSWGRPRRGLVRPANGYRRGVLAIAALVPETALLVPGAAGRAVVLEDVRAAAVDAGCEVVRAVPDRMVVVAPGPRDRVLDWPVRPSLAAAGVDDTGLGWTMPETPLAPGGAVPGVGASVVLLLLARAGWAGPVTVVEVAPSPGPPAGTRGGNDTRAEALRALGADLVAGSARVALLVAGSLSARHGPRAPHADDERAAPFDAATLADLALADPPARQRLGAVAGSRAAELEVTAWAPLQVLLGAAADGPSPEARVRHASAPFGVTYAVAVWRGSAPAVLVAARPEAAR